uniref:Uncharacterized protein n=1 Tax=Oryza glumipatula TaxID=40148 RepID=A0A0D9Y794_9ORYZ
MTKLPKKQGKQDQETCKFLKWFEEDKVVEGAKRMRTARHVSPSWLLQTYSPTDKTSRSLLQRIKEDSIEADEALSPGIVDTERLRPLL